VLLLAGCGPSGNFSRDTSAKCVELHGGRVSNRVGAMARHAEAGAFRARVGIDTATVAFERTNEDAKRLEAAYARALKSAGEDPKYVLFRYRNAVVVWSQHPGDENGTTLRDCLVTP
jgi:hypothetical protein